MNDNLLHINRIKNALQKIRVYLTDKVFNDLQDDDLLYDAVLMELLLIGEEASRINNDYKVAHSDIPWHKIIGMRNRITHEYFHVDPKIIWDTCSTDLPSLERQIEELE